MNAADGLKKWRATLKGGSTPEKLATMLRDDAVFYSPVVHTPQEGKALVIAYLSAAGTTLGGGGLTYVREVIDGDTAVLEFTSELDGIHINGIDMITFDEEGLIKEFKVMVRPTQGDQQGLGNDGCAAGTRSELIADPAQNWLFHWVQSVADR